MDISASERAEKTKIELQEYYRFRRNIKYWAYFSGSWPIKDANFFYRALPFLVFTSTSLICIQQFRFVFANITNIGVMVGGFSLGTSFLSVAMKVALFKFHRLRLLEIHTILDGFHKESLADENSRYFVLEKLTGFRRLTKILSICVLFGCVFCIIGPMLLFVAQIRRNIRPLKYTLPTPAVYPWNTHDIGLLYILTFIYESYNVIAIGVVTLGIDGLFEFYIFFVIGQLRVLSEQMINFKATDDHNAIVRQWVTKFLVLKKCCQMLQTIYGPIILWQVVTNSTVICTVLFQVTHVSGISIGRYLLIFGYSGTKIMQTYLYSWAGSSLTAESEALGKSVYFCDWVSNGCQRLRTSVLIILTQKPLVIVAAGCVYISLDMFLMTLNTAVSYFFLLQTFEEKAS
ncbi:odorant receptor Or2 [Diachasma alloeum]|uniref:Odorant receptor n=1 Tax=Diachasma alloeum TaxID=454923 RepID=A0A4E0S3N7_9HYME|nr:odorant receptor Or2 [Diachasma alloeum]THK32885.1 odorant receptor 169 [Diachasma alloeum]